MAPTADGAAFSADERSEPVALRQRLGRFVVLDRLGSGGMGAVYAAYDEQLDRKVALKLLHNAGRAKEAERLRVLREAQALARVTHPNIVHAYDVGEVNGQIFIAMEYIAGLTLAAWQKEPRPWQELLRAYRQAGAGLLAAHQTGLVHRDFKPDNVLIDAQGRARVVDFGVARLLEGAQEEAQAVPPSAAQPVLRSPLTADGAIVGTPGYMAPEQYVGKAVDARSDQFSFCVAIYEALYRYLPFAGETLAEMAANVLAGRPLPAPRDTVVPIEIQRALLRGMALEPAARFPTMAELLAALDVDEERDPGGARAARQKVSLAAVIVVSVVAGLTTLAAPQGAGTARDMVLVALFVLLALHLGALRFRRVLLANAFHRGILRLIQVALFTVLGERCLGMALGLPLVTLVPMDLLVMGGGMAAIAYLYLPALWLYVAELAVASVASVLWPWHALQIGNAGHLILAIGLTYLWSRAGGPPSRAKTIQLLRRAPDNVNSGQPAQTGRGI